MPMKTMKAATGKTASKGKTAMKKKKPMKTMKASKGKKADEKGAWTNKAPRTWVDEVGAQGEAGSTWILHKVRIGPVYVTSVWLPAKNMGKST